MAGAVAAMPLLAGRAPEAVIAPAGLDELRAVVAERDGRTLVPVGGGTQLALGGAPRGRFALLDLRAALDGEIEHEPADLTVVAPAGVTLAALDARLAEAGQRLPIDPPRAEEATVGGALATGVGGPLRTRHGPPRDFALGMTVLRADGELVKAGGRVVKNVTGYDLMRLWCGSLGTLGVIASVALRALPRLETVDLRFRADSLAEGRALAERFARADLRPELLDLTRGADGGWHGVTRLAAGAVEAARTVARADLEACDGRDYLAARDLGFGPDDALTLRASCPMGMVEDAARAFAALEPARMLARPLAREARASWENGATPDAKALAEAVRALRAALAESGGDVVAERLPDEYRGAVEPWGRPRAFGRMAAVKAAFDPDGRLNAGRFVGGL